MSTNKKNPLMPKEGSRARSVLTELARHQAPIDEATLMAGHGLANARPTLWRQGPYRMLVTSGLIEKSTGGWCLTARGRALMDESDFELARQEAPPLPVENLALPRFAPPFKSLKVAAWRRDQREGAFDYRSIPSLHSGRPSTHPHSEN